MDRTKEDEKKIRRSYLNQRFSGAFSGLSGFLRNRKTWTNKKKVEKELKQLNAYSLHKDIRRKFKRRRVLFNFINQTWASDLKDISTIAEWNNCNYFVLIVVDAFSKKAYVRMLKNKSSKSMIRAFDSIFREAKTKPLNLFTDRGKEYTSEAFKTYLKQKQIHSYHIYSYIKSMFSERFIRTLFTKLERYMTERKTFKIDDKIQDFVKAYNNTYHSTIKRSPNQVNKKDEFEIWQIIFADYLKEKQEKQPYPKFKVGDIVRISRAKIAFEKGKQHTK